MSEVMVAQGRLKLEVPVGNVAITAVPHATRQVELLNESLEKYRISYDDPVQTAVEEPGCEKFLVFNYEVWHSSFLRTLLPSIRYFLNKLQEAHMPYHFNPTLIIHSISCFSSEVKSCHDQALTAVYFGNIQGGVFINHWEVSFRDISDNPGKKWIEIHFRYDQTEVINITFENPEEKRNGQKKCQGVAHYQIAIRLNFIRRVIVDNAVTDKYGKDRTRIHFELNCPVIIRKSFVRDDNNTRMENVRFDRWCTIHRGRRRNDTPHVLAISDSPVFTIEFDESLSDSTTYEILSRLRVRTGVSIEFATYRIVDKLYSAFECPYAYWSTGCNEDVNAATHDQTMSLFIRDTVKEEDIEPDVKRVPDVIRERTFSLQYLIECLISRGAVVKDQLLLDKTVWIDFLRVLNRCYRESRKVCLYALERLITMIDERKRLGSLVLAFITEYETEYGRGMASTLSWQQEHDYRDGYRKVRKLVITQTRIIYVVPETLMANRVIRSYDHDGTRIIRVTFRDDDNQTMRTNKTSKSLIVKTLKKYMLDGLVVANRSFGYLGSSNSQMRDSGAYFMEKYSRGELKSYLDEYGEKPPNNWQPKIDKARENLGRFTEMESIPKLMARLGQCFTQSKKSGVPIKRCEYCVTYDIVGGSNNKGKEYTYSDGVGMISRKLAADIARDMLLERCVPSCFQFRFRGMKGVTAVDPLLDEISKWAAKNDIALPKKTFGSWDMKIVFRPSQIKFDAMRTSNDSLEVVKYSAPVPVALNKPFICILDQVSEMQSYDCHVRVTNRIEELLETQLRTFARTMLREHDCRNKLKELPKRVDIDRLSVVSGFQLSTEPFFRSLIKATIKYAITKQMRKQQIQIPFDKGRSMLGVVDETGQLQYGQVFVQYTENIALKTPPPNASRKVLTGKVLITKNPCIVAGDVRVFTAVDVPELHHMCDVVVFPMHGPRPHPDEMAGSDLDGDEYSVIWDKDLLLDRNEEPFDYTAEKPETKPISKETLNEDMVDFYISYITQDSVGTISNSFLFQADLYGLKSEVCLRLAKKISQAVDFTKTGLPPRPLVKDWTEDEETGKQIPPEKSERQPDFHFGNDYEPIYRSARLLGQIYREIKAIEEVLKISEDIDEQDVVKCDRYLMVEGWDKYKEIAETQLSKYKGRLRAIMENYGIKTEGEVFSGCICEMRNRISDKDQDDMSFYNTNEVIERKVTNLFREYREEFFQEFGGWERCTKLADKKFAVEGNICHRHVQHPSLEMQQKAVAYYRVCYETAQQTLERMLSFAWLAYDVLALVKQERIINDEEHIPAAAPLYDVLKKRIAEYCCHHKARFFNFVQFPNEEARQPLRMYTEHYPGLSCVMFIVSEWAAQNQLFTGRLQSHHLCLILILFAIGRIVGCLNRSKPFLEKLEGMEVSTDDPEEIDEDNQMELIVAFFEYLASRAFRKLQHISFDELGYASVFLRGEWIPVHEMAVKTYYNMVFNLQFDELNDEHWTDPGSSVTVRECEPFVIELPENFGDEEIKSQIKLKTGIEEIVLRRLKSRHQDYSRVAVSARGTVQSLRMLRDLVTVKPLIKTAAQGKEISRQLCTLIYENIVKR